MYNLERRTASIQNNCFYLYENDGLSLFGFYKYKFGENCSAAAEPNYFQGKTNGIILFAYWFRVTCGVASRR